VSELPLEESKAAPAASAMRWGDVDGYVKSICKNQLRSLSPGWSAHNNEMNR
jgi:hypothetical protein